MAYYYLGIRVTKHEFIESLKMHRVYDAML